MKKVQTLCIIQKDSQILLGMKKRGFGEGRWNGFGGKVQIGETVEDAVQREMKEESGIAVADIKKRGVLAFEFADNPEVLEVHIFSASDFQGEPQETEEMKPQWFKIEEIPYDLMWPDDKHWLPLFLAGKNFQGHFYFSDFNTIIRHKIEEIESF